MPKKPFVPSFIHAPLPKAMPAESRMSSVFYTIRGTGKWMNESTPKHFNANAFKPIRLK